ncbi:MAG: UDP-N-acetylmuramate dehydrogenase [Bacteroidales bacterium]|jgi:UDP-N-acetylmuramate dehydrogenase|nr:UDP-N-acetylmuramate dehydrogenase [Bacteroidales bacterium]
MITVAENVPLQSMHTFNVNANARKVVTFTDEQNIAQAIDKGVFAGQYLIMGDGSNLLFTKDYEGTIVRLQNKGIRVIDETSDTILLRVNAGESWKNLIRYAIDNEYYGIENLAGIPGWVGSAPVQNIGAYGMEVKDCLYVVHGVDLTTGTKREFANEDCRFAYRNSIFKTSLKNRFFITKVDFLLHKKKKFNLQYKELQARVSSYGEKLTLRDLYHEIMVLREGKLPATEVIGSAGSFFKNPCVSLEQWSALSLRYPELSRFFMPDKQVKLSAAQLIERAGWKGKREGQVGTYPQQPLVIVNYGGATGSDILRFAHAIQTSVFEKFDVRLEPEVNIIS